MMPKPPDLLRKSHRHAKRKERATAKEALRQEALDAAAELEARYRYNGACRCGAVRYVFITDIPPADWIVRRCSCEFCTRHAALYASDPTGSVEIHAETPAAIDHYCFGQDTADFLVCHDCGEFVAAPTSGAGQRRAVVNLRLLEDPPNLPHPVLETHAAETREARRRRHAKQWTPL